MTDLSAQAQLIYEPFAVLVRYQLTRRSISYLLSFPRIPKSMIGQKGFDEVQ